MRGDLYPNLRAKTPQSVPERVPGDGEDGDEVCRTHGQPVGQSLLGDFLEKDKPFFVALFDDGGEVVGDMQPIGSEADRTFAACAGFVEEADQGGVALWVFRMGGAVEQRVHFGEVEGLWFALGDLHDFETRGRAGCEQTFRDAPFEKDAQGYLSAVDGGRLQLAVDECCDEGAEICDRDGVQVFDEE